MLSCNNNIIGVYLKLKGTVYSAGSMVWISAVGEGVNALSCMTNKDDCCARSGNRLGEFYYPNGVKVPTYSRSHGHSFYRSRGDGVVTLNKKAYYSSVLQISSGEYCCEVPDACGDIQRVCINLVYTLDHNNYYYVIGI